ncbi:MAG: hypothetical protein J3Q66DRAFT_329459 [Benniella sp.]|nr:MAG: hypothetical protein J3Q66DRAFT_329459 [Benniella sp.]
MPLNPQGIEWGGTSFWFYVLQECFFFFLLSVCFGKNDEWGDKGVFSLSDDLHQVLMCYWSSQLFVILPSEALFNVYVVRMHLCWCVLMCDVLWLRCQSAAAFAFWMGRCPTVLSTKTQHICSCPPLVDYFVP